MNQESLNAGKLTMRLIDKFCKHVRSRISGHLLILGLQNRPSRVTKLFNDPPHYLLWYNDIFVKPFLPLYIFIILKDWHHD